MDREETTALAGVVLVFIIMMLVQGFGPCLLEKQIPSRGYKTKERVVFKVEGSQATVPLVAVDGSGKGLTGWVTVIVIPGSGRILVDIGSSMLHIDAQESAVTAAWVASEVTGVGLGSLDIIYTIESPGDVVEGPSAGASLAIATIAALDNRIVKEGVAITGSLEEDGSIGEASGLREKARAAKEANMSLMIIPSGFGFDAEAYKKQEVCETREGREYCRTDYIPDTERLSEYIGIEVEAVGNITEALGYFFEQEGGA